MKIGRSISRKKVLQILQKIKEDAENARLEIMGEEANRGIQYNEEPIEMFFNRVMIFCPICHQSGIILELDKISHCPQCNRPWVMHQCLKDKQCVFVAWGIE